MELLKKSTLPLLIVLLITSCSQRQSDTIDLSGSWIVSLENGAGDWFKTTLSGEEIMLPSTLDEAGIGEAHQLELTLTNDVLSNLARRHQYIGKARFEKEIDLPPNWEKEVVELKLERVLWTSTLYVNGQLVNKRNSLSSPHVYEVSGFLRSGKNRISIEIDNTDQFPLINVSSDKYPDPVNQEMAHAYTNHTQIKWNGILGDILLSRVDTLAPKQVKIKYDFDKDQIVVDFQTHQSAPAMMELQIIDKVSGTLKHTEKVEAQEVNKSERRIVVSRPDALQLWDEFHPNIYTLKLGLEGHQSETSFGLREIGNDGKKLILNGRPIFLRGNLECSIFPLTGHPPLEKEGWLKLYEQAKAYGLNHIRFHSWCPPEAAFEAADEVGIYLQVELPHWSLRVGEDEETTGFLREEALNIIKTYGNHPSFVMMSLGNELQGDIATLKKMTQELKDYDDRRLFATTTFSFQRPLGIVPQEEDDFFVTQWTDKGWIRGQGIFNDKAPHFDADYTANMEHLDIPVISHEIGQYSVYPDLREIERYTGVLEPMNFKAIRKDLEEKQLIDQAEDFTAASGKLAALLYKEEIERAMKTPEFDGFQLLQLQDFPGQGTALVGLLNAFWESKGIIEPEEFRMFNSELVPLIRYEKATYEDGEEFSASIEVANYYQDLEDRTLVAIIMDEADSTVVSQRFEGIDLSIGHNAGLGQLRFPISAKRPEKYRVEVRMEDSPYKNTWTFWVYPTAETSDLGEVVYTRSLIEAERALAENKTVLLNPEIESIKGVQGRFVPVFWSPVHFPDQPSTMGILVDPDHPAFSNFTTSFHSDWQWWDLCKQSKAVDLSAVAATPVVQVIDNFVTNRKLATVFEAKVGEGKLLYSSIDLSKDLANRPVARQLRTSLLEYLNSPDFTPSSSVDFTEIRALSNE